MLFGREKHKKEKLKLMKPSSFTLYFFFFRCWVLFHCCIERNYTRWEIFRQPSILWQTYTTRCCVYSMAIKSRKKVRLNWTSLKAMTFRPSHRACCALFEAFTDFSAATKRCNVCVLYSTRPILGVCTRWWIDHKRGYGSESEKSNQWNFNVCTLFQGELTRIVVIERELKTIWIWSEIRGTDSLVDLIWLLIFFLSNHDH